MELDFTADQEELRASVRAVLDREWPIANVRAMAEGDATSLTGLWKTLSSLDWPALALPEEHGGVGLGFVELAVLAEELGRVVAPGPLLPTLTQFVPAVEVAGGADDLAAVAGGRSGTLAVAEDGRWDLHEVATEATATGDAFALRGTKTHVFDANVVDAIAVVARVAAAGELGLVLVAPADAGMRVPPPVDGSRFLVTLVFEDTPAHLVGTAPVDAFERVLDEATVALALEMVGTCQAIFDMTLQYAKDRHQFGVSIGSFQAVKHKLADMLVAIERARATCYFAAATIAEDDPRRRVAASMAKAAAGDAQRLVAQDGIQLHGGIGYTWEHDLHLYVKRVKTSEPLFGSSAVHRGRIADHLGL